MGAQYIFLKKRQIMSLSRHTKTNYDNLNIQMRAMLDTQDAWKVVQEGLEVEARSNCKSNNKLIEANKRRNVNKT